MNKSINDQISQYIFEDKTSIFSRESLNDNYDDDSLYIPESDEEDEESDDNYDDNSLYNPDTEADSDSNSDSDSDSDEYNDDNDSEVVSECRNIIFEFRRRIAAKIGLEKRRTSELEERLQDCKFEVDMGRGLDRTTMKGKRRKESTRDIYYSDGEYESEDDSEKR